MLEHAIKFEKTFKIMLEKEKEKEKEDSNFVEYFGR